MIELKKKFLNKMVNFPESLKESLDSEEGGKPINLDPYD